MNNEENKEIKDKVLEAIKSGQAKMKPKWHFILKGVLLVLVTVIALVVLLYLSSFTLFTLRQTGVWFAPTFGPDGWFAFFRYAPWILIGLSVAFLAVLEILARRYAFTYRKPMLYSLLGLLVIIFVGGFLIEPWHGQIFKFARKDRLPPFVGGFYRDFDMRRFNDIHRGEITAVVNGGFVLKDASNDETSTVMMNQNTHLPGGTVAVGDSVVVFGMERDHLIQARGVAKIGQF